MARKVVWSYESTDDLEAVAEYIARDSSFYAAAFVREVLDASRSLNDFQKEDALFLSLVIRIFVSFL